MPPRGFEASEPASTLALRTAVKPCLAGRQLLPFCRGRSPGPCRDQTHELSLLDDSVLLIEQLPQPCHPAGSPAVRLDRNDFCGHAHSIGEEDGRFKPPVRDTHQSKRGRPRMLRAQPSKHAESEETVGNRSAKRRLVVVLRVKWIVIPSETGKISHVLSCDLAPVTDPTVTDREIFEAKRLGFGQVIQGRGVGSNPNLESCEATTR